MSGFRVTWNAWLFIGGTSYLPPHHRLQMTCVCIWAGRLNLSSIAETASSYNRLSTRVCSMSGKDKDLLSGWGKDKDVLSGLGKMVSCLAGRGMSFLWLAGNLCSSLPGFIFDPGFLISVRHDVDALERTSSLQARPDRSVSKISKYSCVLRQLSGHVPVPLSHSSLWPGSFARFTTKFPF